MAPTRRLNIFLTNSFTYRYTIILQSLINLQIFRVGWKGKFLFLYDLVVLEETGHQANLSKQFIFVLLKTSNFPKIKD
jgi:hypothetical protein